MWFESRAQNRQLGCSDDAQLGTTVSRKHVTEQSSQTRAAWSRAAAVVPPREAVRSPRGGVRVLSGLPSRLGWVLLLVVGAVDVGAGGLCAWRKTRKTKQKLGEKPRRRGARLVDRGDGGSPVCWMLWGVRILARGGTPLYWGRSAGACGCTLL
ncbi:hypothetical protein EYF80_048898 [Liparis tanakae]|uniref:Uncharacterized protein n=1 Tax=Liparis tanakae TaxID=230148 RepID=A0A4Z2FJ22_9TELE|nr:hypothetical protein EYF80_048898 [Liparis tanakae]